MKKTERQTKNEKKSNNNKYFVLFTFLYRKNHILLENILGKTQFMLLHLYQSQYRLSYLLNRGTTWHDLQRPTTSKKRPETTYNEPETTWNDLQRARNDLNDQKRPTTSKKWPITSKKRPETTYNEQETTWNNLQVLEKTCNEKKRPGNDLQRKGNDLKQPTTSKGQPIMTWTYLQRAKKRRETTGNKQIFRLFYNMGQTVLFSNTFSTQHLVAIIRALLHGESRS